MATSADKTPLSVSAADRLKPWLERLLDDARLAKRVAFDPVELPRRYQDPRDIEVVGLLSALLAYGRVDLFKPKVEGLLKGMGRSPSAFVSELDPVGADRLLRGFVYRFNVATDVAVLLLGMGRALRKHGSLEALFLEHHRQQNSYREALTGFTKSLRQVPLEPLRRRLGAERGLSHLLPESSGTGAAKRLNLFMRWMVRGPDVVDLGVWKQVPASLLRVPLDTHIARLSKLLGLTQRKDLGWRTAEEITASLRRLDPLDPVKYDFALCHHGMSGMCPSLPLIEHCRACSLVAACRLGRRRIG
jgi:uncharacterized protein (TIGR02757 family)